jgi:hypothetical protein
MLQSRVNANNLFLKNPANFSPAIPLVSPSRSGHGDIRNHARQTGPRERSYRSQTQSNGVYRLMKVLSIG